MKKLSLCLLISVSLISLFKKKDNKSATTNLGYKHTQNLGNGILLHGTIVKSQEIIPSGWLFIKDQKIISISTAKPNIQDAVELNTNGIIFPGLIDLHNHIPWNVISKWNPGKKFLNRYQWRIDPSYQVNVDKVSQRLNTLDLQCEMSKYGEIRALIGGTTSIIGGGSCTEGLVRNLDKTSELSYKPVQFKDYTRFPFNDYTFYPSDLDGMMNVIFLSKDKTGPVQCGDKIYDVVDEIQVFLNDNNIFSRLFLIHLAEGIDAASRQEFCYLKTYNLLKNKTAIVHGTALSTVDFQQMENAGASLIWSPKSDIRLYGKTTNIKQALAAGLSINKVALSPDWAISGSNNLLYELRFAYKYNKDSLNSLLTDEQLVKMATEYPAQIAKVGSMIGSLEEGYYADLLIITGDKNNPYHALTQAGAQDVQLVMVGGKPLYGKSEWMNECCENDPVYCNLDTITINGISKTIRMPGTPGRYFPNTHNNFFKLQDKLKTSFPLRRFLAPLIEPE